MTALIRPGVFIEEHDDSLYAPAISPTIVGIIGTGTKGPLNERTLITNEAQLVSTFGIPRTTDWGLHSAIEVLKTCRLVYYVRIAGLSANAGFSVALDDGSAATYGTTPASGNAAPFNLVSGDTLTPITDVGTATATFTGTPAQVDGAGATYTLNGLTLVFEVDNDGNTQTITFTAAETNAATTAQKINADANGLSCTVNGLEIRLTSDLEGTDSEIDISASSTALAGLGLSSGVTSGGGNVANIDTVTTAEVKTLVEAALASCTVVPAVDGTFTIRTNTIGSTGTIAINAVGSTAAAAGKFNMATGVTYTGTDTGTAANTVKWIAKSYGSHSADIDVVVSASSVLSGTLKVVIYYRDIQVEVYDRLYKGTIVSGGYELVATINNGNTTADLPASEYITVEDLNAATAAELTCVNAETYNLNAINAGGDVQLSVGIDGGTAQEINFSSTDPLISSFAAVTAAEAVSVINAQIVGAVASVDGTKVKLTSSTVTATSEIDVGVPAGGAGQDANDATNGFDFSTTAVNGVTNGENPAATSYTLSTGDNGDDWVEGDVIGSAVAGSETGLQLFASPSQVYINILLVPGISFAAVITAALDLVLARADCLAVFDAPDSLTGSQVVAWHNGTHGSAVTVDQNGSTEVNSTSFNSNRGCIYAPFAQVYDKYNDENIWIPMSGFAVRTMCYVDNISDPWIPPAGPVRSQTTNILALSYEYSDGEQDLLAIQGNNVNPCIKVNGVGMVINGQKTLQRSPTTLDRINVRRLLLAIEKVIAQSVYFLTFDLNDSVLWRRFIALVDPFMADVKARRGVIDYRIVADDSTTTPLLQNQKTMLGKIFLQPNQAAERIRVSFNILPAGASFEEYVQA